MSDSSNPDSSIGSPGAISRFFSDEDEDMLTGIV